MSSGVERDKTAAVYKTFAAFILIAIVLALWGEFIVT